MTDPLPADVAEVLDTLLNKDDPVHIALRQHVPHITVRERCTCGCGSAYFDLDKNAVVPAPVDAGTVIAAEAPLISESGEHLGEVLVFTEDGYLSWLELGTWNDGTTITLAVAQQWLRC